MHHYAWLHLSALCYVFDEQISVVEAWLPKGSRKHRAFASGCGRMDLDLISICRDCCSFVLMCKWNGPGLSGLAVTDVSHFQSNMLPLALSLQRQMKLYVFHFKLGLT